MSQTSIPLSSLRFSTELHRLSNGLQVVAHEDRSSPIVAVHLMYHVGSKNERPGRTGLAHLLEHLLFEGSAHCPKGEFDRLLEEVGGTNNGSTWLDRTNYYETVPSHAVELALWLERERMAHFLPVLDEEMLELQRGVVINERKQAYENRPYGMADERLHGMIFPQGHPYSWPTIGFMPDLEAITLSDARSFYESYYQPANAVLVLAGDVGPGEAFDLAEQYFGDISGGPVPPAQSLGATPTPGPRHDVMADRVTFPRHYWGYAVPRYGTADWITLDVLAYLLADGESSRLQRQLVREQQLAQEVDTFLYPTEMAGVFGLVATGRSGIEPDALFAAMERVLDEVATAGVSEEEVASAVRRVRRDQVGGTATIEDRADDLAYATTVLGSPDELERLIEGYTRVTPDAVQRAAATYLSADHRSSLLVVPSGEVADD